MSSQLVLNIYGYRVLIQSDLYSTENLKAAIDFKYFIDAETNKKYHLEINLYDIKNRQTNGFCIGKTKMCRVRQKSFNCRQLEYIYNNKTIALVDDNTANQTRFLSIRAINLDVIDDILYFFLNSSAGEYLEYNGMMRLHALSYIVNDQVSLVHGAPGFGKSTLALELIKNSSVKIFSDEITILDLRTKMLHPYPLRIASVNIINSDTPSQNVKFVYFFNKKSLVAIENDKIATPATLNSFYKILDLEKNTSIKIKISLLQKINLSLEILGGTGLIQMWEYLLRLNNPHIICGILLNRLKLIWLVWKISGFSLNKNSTLSDKTNSLLQI